MKHFFPIIFCCFLVSALNAQNRLRSASLEMDYFLMGHPLLFNKGFQTGYTQALRSDRNHHLAFAPEAGALFNPDIQNRFFLTVLIGYQYSGPKGSFYGLFIGESLIINRLPFDRIEYDNGNYNNRGKYSLQFGPVIRAEAGRTMVNIEKIKIGPFLGLRLAKLEKAYRTDFSEGFKPAISFGIRAIL